MLARITGTLEAVEGNKAVVALTGSGLAYEALLPAYLAERLHARRGETITLHTLQHLEAHAQGSSYIPRLMGFESEEDRRFFELFTTVKGVGARRALRAMAEPISVIANAIASRDAAALQRLPEIGKRLADTIVAELHGRVDAFAINAAAAVEAKPAPDGLREEAEQAIEALVRLGETRAEAERRVRRAVDANPDARAADAILAAAFATR